MKVTKVDEKKRYYDEELMGGKYLGDYRFGRTGIWSVWRSGYDGRLHAKARVGDEAIDFTGQYDSYTYTHAHPDFRAVCDELTGERRKRWKKQ